MTTTLFSRRFICFENGKLPNNEMFMIDRISEINSSEGFENGFLKGELDINPDLWFLTVISLAIQLCLMS